ncbi:hypothetical protein ACW2Q0_07330 [Nocardia sp. R16R-3T]
MRRTYGELAAHYGRLVDPAASSSSATRPATWHDADVETSCDTRLYGTATAQAWDRLHPISTRRAAWAGYEAELPIISGTVIRLRVEHLPSGGVNKPVWL